jgi:hypothetical protein
MRLPADARFDGGVNSEWSIPTFLLSRGMQIPRVVEDASLR